MIVHKCPSQNAGPGFFDQVLHSIHKRFTVFLILEDISSLNPPYHCMMQGPGNI